MTPRRLALLILGASLLWPAAAPATPPVEYLYIEANEGGSSGGHVALRLGDRVFHFQHRAPGMVALAQASFADFRRQYADFQNRTIHVTRLDAGDEMYARLVERFTRRQVVQDQQLSALGALRRDRRALEAMLDGSAPVDAAGFFAPARSPDGGDPLPAIAADEEPGLRALRSRVESARGSGFIAERVRELRRGLGALDPEALDLPEPGLAGDRVPAPTYGFVERYGDAAAGLLALDVLASARRLDGGEAVADPGEALDAADVAAVGRLADSLAASLVSLLGSSRPDWGEAALLGMARLIALRETQAAGRWKTLGFAPSAAGRRPMAARPDVLRAELGRAQASWSAARQRLLAASEGEQFPEVELADLERAGSRLAEVGLAIAERRPARAFRGALPARPARVPLLREVDREALARGLALVRAREERYREALAELYDYNVMTRNCVTELLLEMDAAAGSDGRSAAGLEFIPALSPSAVREVYPVVGDAVIPSYRARQLARMRERESAAGVFLRESNTWSSTIYRRNPEDSTFLFFTDDAVAARPLLGAANLLVGAGASVAGLAMLPADGGETLMSGLRGMLFSLPELVFQNIRKGSFEDASLAE